PFQYCQVTFGCSVSGRFAAVVTNSTACTAGGSAPSRSWRKPWSLVPGAASSGTVTVTVTASDSPGSTVIAVGRGALPEAVVACHCQPTMERFATMAASPSLITVKVCTTWAPAAPESEDTSGPSGAWRAPNLGESTLA